MDGNLDLPLETCQTCVQAAEVSMGNPSPLGPPKHSATPGCSTDTAWTGYTCKIPKDMFPTASSFAETWHFSERKPVFFPKSRKNTIIQYNSHILKFTLEFPENRSKHRLFLHQKICVVVTSSTETWMCGGGSSPMAWEIRWIRFLPSDRWRKWIEKNNKNPMVFGFFLE